eukprot:1184005-Pleurochrysis_carterae.AAC.1
MSPEFLIAGCSRLIVGVTLTRRWRRGQEGRASLTAAAKGRVRRRRPVLNQAAAEEEGTKVYSSSASHGGERVPTDRAGQARSRDFTRGAERS